MNGSSQTRRRQIAPDRSLHDDVQSIQAAVEVATIKRFNERWKRTVGAPDRPARHVDGHECRIARAPTRKQRAHRMPRRNRGDTAGAFEVLLGSP